MLCCSCATKAPPSTSTLASTSALPSALASSLSLAHVSAFVALSNPARTITKGSCALNVCTDCSSRARSGCRTSSIRQLSPSSCRLSSCACKVSPGRRLRDGGKEGAAAVAEIPTQCAPFLSSSPLLLPSPPPLGAAAAPRAAPTLLSAIADSRAAAAQCAGAWSDALSRSGRANRIATGLGAVRSRCNTSLYPKPRKFVHSMATMTSPASTRADDSTGPAPPVASSSTKSPTMAR